MAFSLIVKAAVQSANSNGFTSASFNSSGGNCVFVVLNQTTSGTGTISDNKGNTYNQRTVTSFGQATSIWYAENATCGTGHTITVSGTGNFPAFWYGVFSGGLTSGIFNKEASGNVVAGGTTLQAGSATPDQDDSLIIAGLGIGAAAGSTTITGGFNTPPDQLSTAGGAAFGVSGSYLIQTSAAAAQPTWNWSGSDNRQAVMSIFKPTAGAPPGDLSAHIGEPITGSNILN